MGGDLAENAQAAPRSAAKRANGTPASALKGVGMGTAERRQWPPCSSGKHASAGGCVSWGEMKSFLDMASDALRAKSVANDMLQTELAAANQQLEAQTAEYDEVIDAEQQLHEDSGFLKQQLEALLQERATCRESIARLERENQFLLEERDLLSQQLAAENLRESTSTPLQGGRGGPGRVLSPIPYFTPATPSVTGEDAEVDPLSSGWRGFGTAGGSSDSLVGTPPLLSAGRASRHEHGSAGRCTPDANGFRHSPEPSRRGHTPDASPALPEQRRTVLLAELRARYSSGGGATPSPVAMRSPLRSASSPTRLHALPGEPWQDAASPNQSLTWGAAAGGAAFGTPFFTPAPGTTQRQSPTQSRGPSSLARLAAADVPLSTASATPGSSGSECGVSGVELADLGAVEHAVNDSKC